MPTLSVIPWFASSTKSWNPRHRPHTPRSPQKQFTSKPLDTLPLHLPTSASNPVDVEEVSATNLVARPPRPLQDPLSSTEAVLRRSTPLPPTFGKQIRAPFCDAKSTLRNETRLRDYPPDAVRQLPGVYATTEPVSSIAVPLSTDFTYISLLRAERTHQLVQITIDLPTCEPCLTVIRCSCPAVLCPVLLRSACATILLAVLRQLHRSTHVADPSCTFGRNGSRNDSLRSLRSSNGLPTHAGEANAQSSIDSAHQRSPAQTAHNTDAGLQSTSQPLPHSIQSRVRVHPHPAPPAEGTADAVSHWRALCSSTPAVLDLSSRVLAPPVHAAYVLTGRSLTTSGLATTSFSMGKRKPKTTCTATVDSGDSTTLLVPTNAAFHRTFGRREAEHTDTRRHLTADHAKTADPYVPPTNLVGASGNACHDRTSTSAHHRTTVRTSHIRSPPDPPKENRASSSATPSTLATPPAAEPSNLPHRQPARAQASGCADQPCRPVNLSCSISGDSRVTDQPCRYSRMNSGPPPLRATEPPPQSQDEQFSPSHVAYLENIEIDMERYMLNDPPYVRTATYLRKEIEHFWDSWCAYHPPAPCAWTEAWSRHPIGILLPEVLAVPMDDTATIGHAQLGSCTADLPEHRRELSVDSARSLLPPRARRAVTIDQKLPAPRRSTDDAEDVSTPLKAARCQASRATQEPLEPLAVASPPTCAFCGQLHLSCECDVYLTFTQRLRRAGQLGCCFSCLGQGHHSFACPGNTSIKCSLCRHGQHHEALCRAAAPRQSLKLQPAPCRAPTTSAPTAVAPANSCMAPVPASTHMRRTCAFYHFSHWSLKCTFYVSVSQRLRRAAKLELCFVCLRKGHHAISCPSRALPCKFCSNGTHHHHRALCRSRAIAQRTKALPIHRATKLPTTRAMKLPANDRADGAQRRKKRVNATRLCSNDRNVCPPIWPPTPSG
ncbi:Pao retrotransposon peptidase family protein, partial [Aphelenchoides avenae]